MRVTVRQWDDPTTWNQFVASTPDAHFQQSWEWGELSQHLGGKAIRLAAMSGDRVVGAAQVFEQPIARTGRTYLYIPRGPAVSGSEMEVIGPLLDAAKEIGRGGSAVGIRVEPNVSHGARDWQRSLSALGLRPTFPPSQPRSSWILDLLPDEDTLLSGMKQKTRYNIRLAGRKQVKVIEGSPDDLEAFYALYRETADRDGFFIHDRSFYTHMFNAFQSFGNFRLLLAHFEDTLIAAMTLMRFGSTCWYVHGASSNAHRNLMAPYLLQWDAIQRAKSWGCRIYDFRAIPDVLREDQDMYGVYRFKEGFGGSQFTVLDTYTAPYRPLMFGLWQLYFRGRFDISEWNRKRQGLPARQFA
ncbi:MAG: lipid II:glycine glycyltransferase FemX [Chloroflexota bacterium]